MFIGKSAFGRTVDVEEEQNHYVVMGVPRNATLEQIKERYRDLVKEYHPDMGKGHDPSIFIRIDEAYDILKDTELRTQYDVELHLKESRMEEEEFADAQQRRRNTGYQYEKSYVNPATSNQTEKSRGEKQAKDNAVMEAAYNSPDSRGYRAKVAVIIFSLTLLIEMICVVFLPDRKPDGTPISFSLKALGGFVIAQVINLVIVFFSFCWADRPKRYRGLNPFKRFSLLGWVSLWLGVSIVAFIWIILTSPIPLEDKDCSGLLGLLVFGLVGFYIAYRDSRYVG